MNTIQKLRDTCVRQQCGLCYYCRQPMWTSDPDSFARQHKLSIRRAKWLRATAEHLTARQDGGKNIAGNIVAACLFCNARRHTHRQKTAPSPDSYLRRVRERVAKGKWHGISIC